MLTLGDENCFKYLKVKPNSNRWWLLSSLYSEIFFQASDSIAGNGPEKFWHRTSLPFLLFQRALTVAAFFCIIVFLLISDVWIHYIWIYCFFPNVLTYGFCFDRLPYFLTGWIQSVRVPLIPLISVEYLHGQHNLDSAQYILNDWKLVFPSK